MLSRENFSKLLRASVFGSLLILIVLIFSQPIKLTSVDLGRHLENGRVLWQNPAVLYTNFYSYTEPNFPFINHHWLSGVVLYGIYLIGGFTLLSVFNVLLALFIFVAAFILARKKANFYLVAALSLPVIFLLSERIEVRPEAFSYLFIILTWLILDNIVFSRKYRRLLWLIPLFILWVNLHIYWFIGLALVGFRLAAEFLPPLFRDPEYGPSGYRAAWSAAKPWFYGFIAAALASLLNPNTWRGFFYPFNILNNYGYEIAENKTIFYLGHLMINYNFLIFELLLGLLVISFLIDWTISRRVRLFELFTALFFSAAALFASRNLAPFALAALILISANLEDCLSGLVAKLKTIWPEQTRGSSLYLAGGLLVFIVSSLIYLAGDGFSEHTFIKGSFGYGLDQGISGAADFWQANKLSGPIFNDYDIGSALIFWLYPREKVFVDNRPEAYPAKFFSETYKPMQTDPAVWQSVSAQYKFKAIWFAYTDSTPWAQQFLAARFQDANWVLVYFDTHSVIFLNKNLNAAATIKKLSLSVPAFRAQWSALMAASPDINDEFTLASLAQLAGQNDLTLATYQNIIFRYPDDRQAYAALGYFYGGSSDPLDLKSAIFYFNRALYYGDKLPDIYDQIGLADWRLGDYKNAESNWQSALGLDNMDASALYYLQQVKNLRLSGQLPAD